MAVYKRTYAGYDGPLTPQWSRFLVLPRASYARLGSSKILMFLYIASWFWPLGSIGYVYVVNNLSVLNSLGIPFGNALQGQLKIDAQFFLTFCWVQSVLAYLMTSLVGPTLVSPDVVNNSLPLYFSRPFSRPEYVIGKMSLLVVMLSAITWVPGLVVFAVQAALAGREWFFANWTIAGAIVISELLWAVLLSLLALAVSAWVKWRIAAAALLLGIFVAGRGLGSAVNQIVRTDYGSLLDLRTLVYTVWMPMFGRNSDTGIDPLEAWVMLALVCAGCVWLLWRKIRPFEVVR